MRKTRQNRPPKEKRVNGTPTKMVAIETKSNSGVKYTHYKLVVPDNPKGMNYSARKGYRS